MNMVEIIEKKKFGKALSADEIDYFVKGAADGSIPDYQLSALLMAIRLNGMNREETVQLTLSMAHSGDMMDLSMLKGKKGQNMWLWGSFALALLLTSAVVFIDPIAEVFSLATDFGFDEFVIAFALALSTIVIVEIVKFFQRVYYKKRGTHN